MVAAGTVRCPQFCCFGCCWLSIWFEKWLCFCFILSMQGNLGYVYILKYILRIIYIFQAWALISLYCTVLLV